MKTFTIDISDLTLNLGNEDRVTDAFVSKIKTKLVHDLQTDLMLRTPVDTGQARNGWQIGGTKESPSVENMVPYIVILDAGSSTQAPTGIVLNAIDSVLNRP